MSTVIPQLPHYVVAQSSPEQHWDWVIRIDPLVVGSIVSDDTGRMIIEFESDLQGRYDPALLQRWAGEMMGTWNAATHEFLPSATSSTYRFASERFPERFICSGILSGFNGVLTRVPRHFWIVIEDGVQPGPVIMPCNSKIPEENLRLTKMFYDASAQQVGRYTRTLIPADTPFWLFINSRDAAAEPADSKSPFEAAVDASWKWYRQMLISEGQIVADWMEVRSGNEYASPSEELVWTTDGVDVQKGRFLFDRETFETRDVEEADGWKVPGRWVDETGHDVTVTHWLPVQEWNEDFAPPAPFSIVDLSHLSTEDALAVINAHRAA